MRTRDSSRVGSDSESPGLPERNRLTLWAPGPGLAPPPRKKRSSADTTRSSWGMDDTLKEMGTLLLLAVVSLFSRGSEGLVDSEIEEGGRERESKRERG